MSFATHSSLLSFYKGELSQSQGITYTSIIEPLRLPPLCFPRYPGTGDPLHRPGHAALAKPKFAAVTHCRDKAEAALGRSTSPTPPGSRAGRAALRAQPAYHRPLPRRCSLARVRPLPNTSQAAPPRPGRGSRREPRGKATPPRRGYRSRLSRRTAGAKPQDPISPQEQHRGGERHNRPHAQEETANPNSGR